MASDLTKLIAAVRKHVPDSSLSIEELREGLDEAGSRLPMPANVTYSAGSVGSLAAEHLEPSQPTHGRTILYLHGGGYALGSPAAERPLAAGLALAASASVVALEYRLAPEHPCPAAVEDATTAYRELLGSNVDPALIAIIGDSAGGGLTVATLVMLRNIGVPLPSAGVCLSPWVDLRLASASLQSSEGDPEIPSWMLPRLAGYYLDGRPADDPIASPLLADLHGLPPLLIQVGSAEALLDDATDLAAAAQIAGVDVTLEVWDDMIHVWHRFAPRLPEATEAIDRIGTWLNQQWPVCASI